MLNKHLGKAFLALTLIITAVLLFHPLLRADEGKEAGVELASESSYASAAGSDVEFRREIEALVTEVIEEKKSAHELDVYGRYMPSSDASSQSGKVELIDAGAEYTYEFKAFGKLPVEFSLENQYVSIKNTTAVPLPRHLIGVSAGIEATVPFFNFDRTYFRLGVYPSYYGQDYSFSSSAFRIPSYYLWIHRPNDKLTLVAGVGVFPDYDSEVMPIFGLIYKPNDKLSFNLIPKRPNVSYELNDKIVLFGEGGYEYGEFEVERDGAKNKVLEYKYAYAGGGLRYKFNKYIESSLSAGFAFNRGLKYRDEIGKVNLESGLYSEFRLEIRI